MFLKNKTTLLYAASFVVLAIIILGLALPFNWQKNTPLCVGLLWTLFIFSVVLGQTNMFSADYTNGILSALTVHYSLLLYICARLIKTLLLDIALLICLLSILMFLLTGSREATLALFFSYWVSSPLICTVLAFAAALSLHQSQVHIIVVLFFPFVIPIVLLAVQFALGSSFLSFILIGLNFLCVPLGIFFIRSALLLQQQ